MKHSIIFIIILTLLLGACRNSSPSDKAKASTPQQINLLDSIVAKRSITGLTDYSSTNYFIYRGQPMGYQYELLKKFAKYLNVSAKLQIDDNLEASMQKLADGRVDILAMGLTVTSERKKHMLFTQPLFYTRQVLVQRKPKGYKKMATADEIESHLIRNTIDLG